MLIRLQERLKIQCWIVPPLRDELDLARDVVALFRRLRVVFFARVRSILTALKLALVVFCRAILVSLDDVS